MTNSYDLEGYYCLVIAILMGVNAKEARILFEHGPNHSVSQKILKMRRPKFMRTLTRKEAIRQMKKEGYSTEVIAEALNCDNSTVKREMKNKEMLDMNVIQSFAEELKRALSQRLGVGFSVSVLEMEKNNGVIQTELCIKEKGSKFAPSIYVADLLEDYMRGVGLEEIVEHILACYSSQTETPAGVMEVINDMRFEKIKDRIMFKLIHTSKNASLLKAVPNIPYLDMSIVFFVLCEDREDVAMTLMIENKHQEYWKRSTDELYQEALANMQKRFPPALYQLPVEGMFLLTNSRHFFGAAVLLYPGVLKLCEEELGKDFFIIASCMDEVMLIRSSSIGGKISSEFREVIAHTSEKDIPAEERLSNHAYRYYSLEDKIISI